MANNNDDPCLVDAIRNAVDGRGCMTRGYALTGGDAILMSCLDGTGRHLRSLASRGGWDANCDQLDMRLGRYGLGRN